MDSSDVTKEASQIVDGTEGCSSSESGWTAYIGSPTHAGASYNGGSSHEEIRTEAYNGDEDDSMASDASSGPSRREKGGASGKKACRKVKNNTKERMQAGQNKVYQQEYDSSNAATAFSHVRGGAQARRNKFS